MPRLDPLDSELTRLAALPVHERLRLGALLILGVEPEGLPIQGNAWARMMGQVRAVYGLGDRMRRLLDSLTPDPPPDDPTD